MIQHEPDTSLTDTNSMQLLSSSPQHSESDTTTNKQSDTKDRPKLWISGCFRIDPRVLIFSTQLIITMCILVLCITKLGINDTCENHAFYGNIVMTIVGLWMPSPLFKR